MERSCAASSPSPAEWHGLPDGVADDIVRRVESLDNTDAVTDTDQKGLELLLGAKGVSQHPGPLRLVCKDWCGHRQHQQHEHCISISISISMEDPLPCTTSNEYAVLLLSVCCLPTINPASLLYMSCHVFDRARQAAISVDELQPSGRAAPEGWAGRSVIGADDVTCFSFHRNACTQLRTKESIAVNLWQAALQASARGVVR